VGDGAGAPAGFNSGLDRLDEIPVVGIVFFVDALLPGPLNHTVPCFHVVSLVAKREVTMRVWVTMIVWGTMRVWVTLRVAHVLNFLLLI
jgi:hypothetical protein